jgi:putative tryptophan/tyrosine transport system substrate-binding protein
MKRRKFLALLGAAWPVSTLAQQSSVPVIGFLSGRWPGEAANLVAAFQRGLAETGHVDGRNVVVIYRWAEGRYGRLPELAAELVASKVAVIAATGGSVAGLAAKAATATIPIVFSSGGDAVKLGLVASLSRPGGNVTGVNLIFGALGGKRLELLREIAPSGASVAVLLNPQYPSAASEEFDVKAAATGIGLEVEIIRASAESDFEVAFATMAAHKHAGLLVADDPFLQGQRDALVRLAARHAIPAVYFSRDFVDAGGLASYGPDIVDAYRLVGVYTGQILNGLQPAALPVLQPTRFALVINLVTAKALGINIPPTLLARADEVIE